jgi:alginate O-acetyltransferase complex protein AlgI
MLFTTAIFAFLFLPIVFAGFFIAARWSQHVAVIWLFVASLYFYGYWMPEFTVLLVTSICVNFVVGRRIASLGRLGQRRRARLWLITGVALDVSTLAYFKYANFFVENLNAVLGFQWDPGKVVLPIGISFFTFTQIAFLADAYQKGVREYQFSHYGLFVTYFPHLIAGPVLHHAQMMPQFMQHSTYRLSSVNIAAGLTIFGIGLFKKVVLADGVSPFADSVFDAAHNGVTPTTVEAWLATMSYTFQLYFDFSGYSDMAIGLSLLFNIRLPYNFNSPYQSLSIADFWRRWHMTLSAFLRDYLYIPLGGNKHGPARRYVNLMITMLLGGLWHGANWTFVFWGGLHGAYLVINHAFRALFSRHMHLLERNPVWTVVAWALTMAAVIAAWVFFRAQSFSSAWLILASMVGSTDAGFAPGIQPVFWNAGLRVETGALLCSVLAAIAFLGPNSNRIGEATIELCRKSEALRFWLLGLAVAACIFLIVLNDTRAAVSPFIYFNF